MNRNLREAHVDRSFFSIYIFFSITLPKNYKSLFGSLYCDRQQAERFIKLYYI